MRKIIHVDMDCFFAAVEMRDNPALRDIPIAIGGSRVQRGVMHRQLSCSQIRCAQRHADSDGAETVPASHSFARTF